MISRFFYITILYLLTLNITVFTQIFDETDLEKCTSIFEFSVNQNWRELESGDLITEVAKHFIGTDYKAHTLEVTEKESLVVNLRGLDCTTLVENVIVFARLIRQEKSSFDDYLDELRLIRYRNGEIDEYPSRLHYFSDWIFENEKRGIVKDVTAESGGEPLKLNLSFMSSNPHLYKHLNNNPDYVTEIRKKEKEISDREYFFIPKKNIREAQNSISNGDIIAITTKIEGLDISHVGIAVRINGDIRLLHAPKPGTKVHITKETLHQYLKPQKQTTGIMIIRPIL